MTAFVNEFPLGALFQQEFGHFFLVSFCGCYEDRFAIFVLKINVSTCRQ